MDAAIAPLATFSADRHVFDQSVIMVFAALLCLAAPADGLVVRDTAVFVASQYGTELNARGLFDSTLPRSVAGRRTVAKEDSESMPCGVITFEGTPQTDVDVLLEFDAGRLLAHLPKVAARSRRVLWPAMSLTTDPPAALLPLRPDQWLTSLRQSDRLWVTAARRSERFLLYDVTRRFDAAASLRIEGDVWHVANSADAGMFDVAIFRPAADSDQWLLATLDDVGPYRPNDGDDEAAEEKTPAEAEAPKPAEAAAFLRGVAGAMGIQISAATETAAEEANDAESVDAVRSRPARLEPVSFAEPAAAEDVLYEYLERFGTLGPAESEHLLRTLQSVALTPGRTTLVFRLPVERLEELLPLEVTPPPAALHRVALVIVPDADPLAAEQIERLVAQLGNDAWSEREQADAALRAFGPAAVPRLREAKKHKDPEVAQRAARILKAAARD